MLGIQEQVHELSVEESYLQASSFSWRTSILEGEVLLLFSLRLVAPFLPPVSGAMRPSEARAPFQEAPLAHCKEAVEAVQDIPSPARRRYEGVPEDPGVRGSRQLDQARLQGRRV